MTNISSKLLIKTTPNPLPIMWGAIGFIFMGFLCFLTYNSVVNIRYDDNNSKMAAYVVLSCFVFFSIWSLSMIIKLKIVILTNTDLIIKFPLLFYKNVIPLNQISEIKETNFNVNPNVKGQIYKIHTGKKCIILLKSQESTSFNSFEILEYNDLTRKLYIAKNRVKDDSNRLEIKNEGWKYLIIILLIIICLGVSILTKYYS